MRRTKDMIIVVIDGLIASGKSTVLQQLQVMGYKTEGQPVHEWTLLESFYNDPKKYAVPLQEQIINSYKNIWQKYMNRNLKSELYEEQSHDLKNNIVFLEACGLSSFEVFVNMLHDDGVLSDEDVKYLWTQAVDSIGIPDYFIYLDCEPTTCLHRCRGRGRKGENKIELPYMQRLAEYYEKFLNRYKNRLRTIKLENNKDDEMYKIAKKIEELIHCTKM